jgi:hypothetical protein
MSELNIYQRLSAITHELTNVAKNLQVGTGSSKYKAVGEADVLSAVKPLEEKYGVYSFPLSREEVYQDVLHGTKEYTDYKTKEVKSKETTQFMLRVKTVYRFVNIDNPSEFVDQVSYGDGVDSLDKAPGKAMTYSDKYSLLKAYKIMTGDDPDQKHSNETNVTGTQGLRITLVQKDKIIKLVQDNKIDLQGVLKYYKVSSVDELNHVQAEQVINKGDSK